MHVHQLVAGDATALSAALAQAAAHNPQLVFVFAAPALLADGALARQLAAALPGATIVGASTAGEIASSGVSDGGVVLTAVQFDRVHCRAFGERLHDNADSFAAGKRLAQRIDLAGLRAVLVLAPGVDVNGSALIRGLQERLPDGVALSGGLAGDAGAFERTYTLLDALVDDRLVAAVAFYGDYCVVSHGSYGGWEPFGPARKVTRCSGNELFELDGEPALAIYERYLGDYVADLPAAGLLFPFELLTNDLSGTGLVRTLLSVDRERGSLTLAGDIDPNGYVRLMHAGTDALVDGAQRAAEAANEGAVAAPSLALLVSCVGRRLVMGPRADEEVEAVSEVFGRGTVLAGFYSNGEISPRLGRCESGLFNQTMTITCLGERA